MSTKDINLYSYYDRDSGSTVTLQEAGFAAPDPEWSDTIKITSRCQFFTLRADVIFGGKEDCVDCNNRAEEIAVYATLFRPQGKYLATIKGGCAGVFLIGRVYGHGKEVDVDLGNWSDQSQEETIGVKLALESNDGKPITIRVLNAKKPKLLDGTGPYKYVFPHPDAWYHKLVVTLFNLWNRLTK